MSSPRADSTPPPAASPAPPAASSAGGFGPCRRWLGRADLLVSVVLALYVLFLVNIVIFRRPARIDFTRERIHTLSRGTLDRLRLIGEEVLVVIPTYLQAENPEHQAQRDVLARARSLLNEYTARQPLIRIAAEVDVFTDPGRWKKVRDEFDLSAGQVNRFIFFAGAAHEYRQAIGPKDMADFQEARDPVIAMPEIKNFRAEKAITDALTRLIERRKRIVYFTQDKEEMSLSATRPDRRGVAGLNALVHELETIGIEARELSTADSKSIPSDCEVLVIASPFLSYRPDEIDALRRYLQRGGRLLVTLGPRNTGLEPLLEEWGVEVLPGKLRGLRVLPGTRVATDWVVARHFHARHPITAVFKEVSRFEVRLDGPRALKGGGLEKGRSPTTLLETGPPGETEAYFRLVEGEGVGDRKPGNFAVAVAVEQLVPERPPPGFQRIDTRLVVFGAGNFLGDDALGQISHRDLVLNTLRWLLGEAEKATVSGGEWDKVVLPSNPSIRQFLFWVPVGLLPALFLAVGAFVYFLRRS